MRGTVAIGSFTVAFSVSATIFATDMQRHRVWKGRFRVVLLSQLTILNKRVGKIKACNFDSYRLFLVMYVGTFAERQGFEPWVPARAQRFSRPPRSTTPASFLGFCAAKVRRVFGLSKFLGDFFCPDPIFWLPPGMDMVSDAISGGKSSFLSWTIYTSA